MKKIMMVVLILSILSVFTACNNNGGNNTASQIQQEPYSNPAETPPQGSSSEMEQTSDGSDELAPETVLMEFSVLPDGAIGNREPLDAPLTIFTLEMPKNWKVEDSSPIQYVYYKDSENSPVAIIKGFSKVLNPKEPFNEVEKSDFTVYAEQIDVLDYPVFLHISKSYNEPSKYFYQYFVCVEDRLVYLEFEDSEYAQQVQDRLNEIVSSFKFIKFEIYE